MAVFTELTADVLRAEVARFNIGVMTGFKPIASGIENTNYFLDTDRGRWVVTVFERLKPEQLPFYLELTEHLKSKGCRVAAPCRSKNGNLFEFVCGKPYSIANRLEGEEIADVDTRECSSMGALLAQMHLAARDFARSQENLRGLSWWVETAPLLLEFLAQSERDLLVSEIEHQQSVAASPTYRNLTATACHCDLFRNNTLIANHGRGDAHVAGVFDFYFAATAPWLFDLAVTVNDWCINPTSGELIEEKVQALLTSYNTVRPLTPNEKSLWRDMLRAAALRFWISRLYDFYLPRAANLLTPHDPTHFERILKDRLVCPLFYPEE